MPASLRDSMLASEMRNELPGSFIGLAALASVTAAVRYVFDPYVPGWQLDLWVGATGAVLLVWLIGLVRLVRRRPSDAEMLRLWLPRARATMTACNLCTIASIWILMPPAPEPLRLAMALVYFGYIVVQLSIATEGSQVAVSAIVGVLGSAAAVLLLTGGDYGVPVALFLGLMGAVLLSVRRLIRANIVAAVEARLRSEQAADQLRQALDVVAAERDARTRFIRAASHDLAQPLQAARLFFDRYRTTRDPAERARAADGIDRAFGSTAALLDDMLTHLKLEAGAVRAVVQPVALDAFAAQLAGDYRPAAEESGIRLIAPRSGLSVVADPHLLKRLLGNLVANGIRHSRGERVLIAPRPAASGGVRIWVLDDGDGIDPAAAAQLFDDFARTASASGGFGLGLASARKLAEVMGGAIGHEPRWRSGSAFWVELPRAPAAAPALDAAA
jgi:signal transduction histidine kinase